MKKIWMFFCLAGCYCQKWLFWCIGGMIALPSIAFGLGLGLELPFDGTIHLFCTQLSFSVALIVMVLRMTTLGSCGKYPSYLLQRIDTPKYQISLGNFLYALSTFFLLWAVQVALLWLFALIYGAIYPHNMGPQTLFLLTHNVDFFHVLLPTLDGGQLAMTLGAWVGLSIACATGCQQRPLTLVVLSCALSIFHDNTIQYFGLAIGFVALLALLPKCWQEVAYE